MLLYFVTCFSFLLLYRYSLPIQPLPPWAWERRLLSFFFWKDLSAFFSKTLSLDPNSKMGSERLTKKDAPMSEPGATVLDLPELALECILERLEPDGLCRMACVAAHLRDMCLSDHLWAGHLRRRWGGVVGAAAQREWQLQVDSGRESNSYFLDGGSGRRRGVWAGYLYSLWPVMLLRSSFGGDHGHGRGGQSGQTKPSSPPPAAVGQSKVSFYRALETGRFWFPAQVFNRENGHVGFMLSCYDAELSYDSRTDTFHARYPPHGKRAVAMESGVTWDRIRAPLVNTEPHDLHISDCLKDLRPKDHVEIQWRRNKQFPYGWWYGVVGHLETCDGNDTYCLCRESDTVVLEFNQYAPGSRWRHTTVNRRDHREVGNEADGFYGGIRKLRRGDEIATWRRFWPVEILE